jgi:uncharacterized protein involved in response to NO
MTDKGSEQARLREPAFFSYGFRPFFLGASLFAGLAVPAWVVMFAGAGGPNLLYPPREWHVHEMVFGFLPAVIAGFLLTAIPNWTDRPPLEGTALIVFFLVWVAGRVVIALPWFTPLLAATIDVAFLVLLAGLVWRELSAAGSWGHAPVGVVISLYACANILFHVLALIDAEPDLAMRMALSLLTVLLTFIGGRLTPNFTREYFAEHRVPTRPAASSRFDLPSLALTAIAAIAWTIQPESMATGWILLAAGLANLGRLLQWYGWLTWREPLVLMLHVGYGWLAISLVALGGAGLGMGLPTTEALHALTTGAVGAMTLAVMTRASLGHTGRPRHAGPTTVLIYLLVNVGALLRVFGPTTGLPINLVLGLAAAAWSGAYLLFALVYGPFLLRPSLDE